MGMVRKLVLSTAAIVALSSGAMAADLYVPSRAPAAPMAMPSGSWDGPYIGASLGYSSGTASAASFSAANPTGWFIGGQVGYNFHLSDRLVGGVEGNLDWSNESGSTSFGSFRINWDGSIRARLGIDFDSILPYAEVGVAFANGTAAAPSGTPSVSGTHTGWVAGVGAEFKLADQLSANVEYRYSNYGSQTYSGTAIALTDNEFRVGLNYHF
jgi:outer membrane immunogenic protein